MQNVRSLRLPISQIKHQQFDASPVSRLANSSGMTTGLSRLSPCSKKSAPLTPTKPSAHPNLSSPHKRTFAQTLEANDLSALDCPSCTSSVFFSTDTYSYDWFCVAATMQETPEKSNNTRLIKSKCVPLLSSRHSFQ
jgi:hypothetical protein